MHRVRPPQRASSAHTPTPSPGSSITRLQTLIDQATTTADLIEAEVALSDRQAELDSLRAQRAYLADQVGMSTL
ncbi:MAG: DUF4349 domain-containing protein, partial [Actinomycetales bacterium]